jgi:hypothetical protein
MLDQVELGQPGLHSRHRRGAARMIFAKSETSPPNSPWGAPVARRVVDSYSCSATPRR